MKLLIIVLLFAIVGKIASAPRQAFPPRYAYRAEREDEESVEDDGSDETELDLVDDEPQDDASDEDDNSAISERFSARPQDQDGPVNQPLQFGT